MFGRAASLNATLLFNGLAEIDDYYFLYLLPHVREDLVFTRDAPEAATRASGV
jgi:hypothetical protein